MSIGEELQKAFQASGHGVERMMERPGLALAKVTNITDPDKLNRVKCLPIENEKLEETDWCYVMAPLGGSGHGQFFFPNVNDLVVLAYLGGDPHRPVVLGALWNTEVKPPYTIAEGKVYNFSIKTPNGTELLFYDEPQKQKVTVTMPSGTTLVLDDENQAIFLKDKAGDNALEMDLKGGNVTLKAKTQLVLSAGDTSITMTAQGEMTQKAKSQVSVETATLEEKGSTKVSIQGADIAVAATTSLNLQASGNTTVKGAMVNIN